MTLSTSDSGLFLLLKRVSRSFYLSVRFLPSRIRPAIAIAYLLARASDTIADTNRFEPNYRLKTLDALRTALEGSTIDLARRVSLCVEAQPQGAERDLLKQLISLVSSVRHLPSRHQPLVLEVLDKIIQGQRLDIERFEMSDSLRALRNAAELEEYTYFVAGSVGEFWTRLCLLEWKSYSGLANSKLERLGVEFGKGLQLINILRDFPADLAHGRSYLPFIDPHQLKANVELARPLLLEWRDRAWNYLRSAWAYVRAIRPVRVRFACALPVLIGART
ncbi:MAG TPA: squalene/phytoene synthase family protein, partial [Chthoniobacterales bacterium]|nr:squalene/phytoene synthase family protein [Chthoniobacterales bacterium]